MKGRPFGLRFDSAKVPRRGSRKLLFFLAKFSARVACQQEAGMMNHVYLPAAALPQEYVVAKATPSRNQQISLWEF